MKEGIYHCCINDFLASNKNNNKKKFLLVAEYTHFEHEYLEKYEGEIVGAIVPFIVYNNENL